MLLRRRSLAWHLWTHLHCPQAKWKGFFAKSPLRLFDTRRIYLFNLPCSWLLHTCMGKTIVIHTWTRGTNVYLTLYGTKISSFCCHIKQPQALFWAQHRNSFKYKCHKWMDHLLNKWVRSLDLSPEYLSFLQIPEALFWNTLFAVCFRLCM